MKKINYERPVVKAIQWINTKNYPSFGAAYNDYLFIKAFKKCNYNFNLDGKTVGQCASNSKYFCTDKGDIFSLDSKDGKTILKKHKITLDNTNNNYRIGILGKRSGIASRVIAECFFYDIDKEYSSNKLSYEDFELSNLVIHHKTNVKEFKDLLTPNEINSLENLQLLTVKTHNQLTSCGIQLLNQYLINEKLNQSITLIRNSLTKGLLAKSL